jgi:hypothetical protein
MFKKSKTTMLTLIVFMSAIIAPGIATVNGQTGIGGFNFDFDNMTEDQISEMPKGMASALGGIFGMMDGLGPSGAALGQVFQIMFENIWSISDQDKLIPGVYTFNATVYEEEKTWTETYSNGPRDEIYWVWDQYESSAIGPDEWAYVNVSRSGSANFTYSSGAMVVFIIWDSDSSFINAIQKVIDAFIEVREIINDADEQGWTPEREQAVIAGIVGTILEAITYLLFHINDIINGDELIITNMITWETMNMTTTNDYGITKEVKIWDDWNLEDDAIVPQVDVDQWLVDATNMNDEYMLWLLGLDGTQAKKDREWSRFSFNLIELWLKNFEIHINAQAIVDILTSGAMDAGLMEESPLGDIAIYDIFQGLNIEFYFMTHSLMGFIAYNDSDGNSVPSVEYTTIIEKDDFGNDVESEVITDSEAKYYFALGSLGTITDNMPKLFTDPETGNPGIEWGIRFDTVYMAGIPMNMDPKDVDIIPEKLDYLEMGFKFIPFKETDVETEGYSNLVNPETQVRMGQGLVKLDQSFGLWNDGTGPANPDLADPDLDFAVVFMSTMLHFELDIDVEKMSEEELAEKESKKDAGLLNETEVYSQASGTIKVGRETGDLPVAAIEIAGPKYIQNDLNGLVGEYEAKTTTIPLAFLDFDASSKVSYADYANPTQSLNVDGVLAIEASIMIYCVNYPTWDGSGDELIHDPTFSVFMEWDNPGFIAVFLAVGSLALVAIAAIMITKRKNRL